MNQDALSHTLTYCHRESPGPDPPSELSSTQGFSTCPNPPFPGSELPSPVEADFVETLFARLVDGVEAGARVLFFSAVWGRGGSDWRLTYEVWVPMHPQALPRYPHKSSTQGVA